MKTFINSYLDLLRLARRKIIFAKEHHRSNEVKRLLSVKREIIERLNLITNEEKRLGKTKSYHCNRDNGNYSYNNNL